MIRFGASDLKGLYFVFLFFFSLTRVAFSAENQVTYTECLDQALLKSIDVRLAELRYETAKLTYASTLRDLQLPKVNLSATAPSYNRSSFRRYEGDVWTDRTATGYTSEFDVAQPLFTGGELRFYTNTSKFRYEYSTSDDFETARLESKLELNQSLFKGNAYRANVRRAARELEQATQIYWGALRDVMILATQTFFNALIAQKRLALEEESLAQYQAVYDMENRKFAEKLSTELNLLEAEINLNNTEILVAQYRDEFAVAQQELWNLLGETTNDSILITEPEISVTSVDWESYLQISLQNSPAVVTAKHGVENYRQSLMDVHKENNLSIDLMGNVGYESDGEDFSQVSSNWDWSKESISVRVRLNYPLWDGGTTSRNIQIAQADLKIAELELQQQINATRIDIEQKINAAQRAETKLGIAKKNKSLLQRKSEIAQHQFENGVLALDEYVDARQQYVEGAIELWTTYSEYRTALWEIEKMAGVKPNLQE